MTAIFDLVSKEYGWTDDQILDLTIGRLRQVTDAISVRRQARWRETLIVLQEHARVIVGGMAGTAFSQKAADGIIRYAERLRLVADEDDDMKRLPKTRDVERLFNASRRTR